MTLALLIVSLLVGAGFGWWLNGEVSARHVQRMLAGCNKAERDAFFRVWTRVRKIE